MMDVAGALEAAADAENPALRAYKTTSSRQREQGVRRLVLRFLENIDEDMTVLELRHELEDLE